MTEITDAPKVTELTDPYKNIRPPFAYVGGKTRMLPHITANIPEKFGNYFEVFLGGGAVAIQVMKNYPHKRYFLSDLNDEVINAWKVIRDNLPELIEELTEHSERHDRDYFYSIRNWDSNGLMEYKTDVERAGRLIYICTVAFGGGYKVDKNEHANGSYGKDYFNPPIANLTKVSNLLNNRDVTFLSRDFNDAKIELRTGDLIYLDPPYATDFEDENYESNNEYVSNEQDDEITELVRKFMNVGTNHGCYVLMSNASTPTTERIWDGWASTSKEVVWSSGGVNKEGKRKTNTERLWANLHLVNALEHQGDLKIDETLDDEIDEDLIEQAVARVADHDKKLEAWMKEFEEAKQKEDKTEAEEIWRQLVNYVDDMSRSTRFEPVVIEEDDEEEDE